MLHNKFIGWYRRLHLVGKWRRLVNSKKTEKTNDDHRDEITNFVQSTPGSYKNLDGNRCRRLSGFQMLNEDEIMTSVQAESDPADDETDEDEGNNNESTKRPSNAGAFSALETAMEWHEKQSECCPTQNTAAQENQRPCSEKTKVYNGTAKKK
ncbi:uncharacterized protein TNCV_2401881 [Trichonephila clavipes]|nr:uncharacterized protein TNCV_2401881 [Trichonephila clavipes]